LLDASRLLGGHVDQYTFIWQTEVSPTSNRAKKHEPNNARRSHSLTAVLLSIGTNVGLYIHLSSAINTRFDSVERRLELMQGSLHDLDLRITS
jgi:hypothetical protein